jgi:effector-binding domain-containing protein
MFRIGEFSRLAQVTVKALRLYDERGLLVPAQVDRSSGYRSYSAAQLPRLQRILALKDLGLTLQEIADLLDEEPGIGELRGMLRLRRAELERELADGRARLARVEAYLARLEREGDMPTYDVTIKNAPALRAATLRATVPHYPDIGRLFGELCGFLGAARVPLTGPPLALYHDGEYREQDVDIEVAACFAGPLPAHPRIHERELPAEPCLACTVHQGPYEELRHAYAALLGWVEANGYRITGPDREIFLVGPEPGRDPARYVTELQVPVARP